MISRDLAGTCSRSGRSRSSASCSSAPWVRCDLPSSAQSPGNTHDLHPTRAISRRLARRALFRGQVVSTSHEISNDGSPPQPIEAREAPRSNLSCSGSFFYFSNDGRYLIKTIPHREELSLIELLPKYVDVPMEAHESPWKPIEAPSPISPVIYRDLAGTWPTSRPSRRRCCRASWGHTAFACPGGAR